MTWKRAIEFWVKTNCPAIVAAVLIPLTLQGFADMACMNEQTKQYESCFNSMQLNHIMRGIMDIEALVIIALFLGLILAKRALTKLGN